MAKTEMSVMKLITIPITNGRDRLEAIDSDGHASLYGPIRSQILNSLSREETFIFNGPKIRRSVSGRRRAG